MPRVPFASLPDHGRLWVFPAGRALSGAEAGDLLETVDAFLDRWAAHGAPLRSARELREDRFLLVGVDVDAESPSGCSIDALVNRLRAWGEGAGVRLIDHAPVWFRDGHGVRAASRAEFRAAAGDGSVGLETPVFDTSLTRVDQLREGALERPASETWHGAAFFKGGVSA
jgi:hypothetical protein